MNDKVVQICPRLDVIASSLFSFIIVSFIWVSNRQNSLGVGVSYFKN